MKNAKQDMTHSARAIATLTSGWWRRIGLLLTVLAATVLPALHAQTYTVLYTFSGGSDGAYPQYGPLKVDPAGSLYGTAPFGGNPNCPSVPGLSDLGTGCGVVFKLDPASKQLAVLYSFHRWG
jgi:hypothetical protein